MGFRQSKSNRRINQDKATSTIDEKKKCEEAKARYEFLKSLKVETKEIDRKTGNEIIKVQYDTEKIDDTNLRKFINNEMIEAIKTFRKLEKNGEKDIPEVEEQNKIIKQYLGEKFGKTEIFGRLEMFLESWITNHRNNFDLADKNKLPNRPGYGGKNIYTQDDEKIYEFELYYKSLEEKQDEIEER